MGAALRKITFSLLAIATSAHAGPLANLAPAAFECAAYADATSSGAFGVFDEAKQREWNRLFKIGLNSAMIVSKALVKSFDTNQRLYPDVRTISNLNAVLRSEGADPVTFFAAGWYAEAAERARKKMRAEANWPNPNGWDAYRAEKLAAANKFLIEQNCSLIR